MSNLWMPLAAGLVLMMVLMLIAWHVQRVTGDAAIVDVAWTLGLGLLAVLALLFFSDGLVARRWLVGSLITLWSIRLGTHLLRRMVGNAEDERYRRLKAGWGDWAQLRLLLFYQSQALVAPLFALPMLVAGNSLAPLGPWDAAGCALGTCAIVFEWQADQQLSQFRQNSAHRGRVCDVGWWRYSRHPNYFFEWVHWCSYVLFAIHAPQGWLTLLTPLAIWYFLCFVTGIPPAEAQALASRGDAYREYQQRTSPFVPWFPRQARKNA